MLDIMRKHTGSWVVKVTFAVIIIVFVFFFGYSAMRSGGKNVGVAAIVNDEIVPYGKYRLALEDAKQFYEQMFKDGIPKEMASQMRNTALMRVVNQALFSQFGHKIGLAVTPAEIYDIISNSPQFNKDGEFDPITYKTVFLPYFENRFGINYETLLHEDLLASKAANFIMENISISEAEAKSDFDRSYTKWSLDRVITDDTELAGKLLAAAAENNGNNFDKIAKDAGLKIDHLNDISISNSYQLIPDEPAHPDLKNIYLLTQDKRTTDTAIRTGNKNYIFRLISIELPTQPKWINERDAFMRSYKDRKKQEALQSWQEKLKNEADIKEFVLAEGN